MTVDEGTDFAVEGIQGNWLAVSATKGTETVQGWVARNEVTLRARRMVLRTTVTRIGDAPEKLSSLDHLCHKSQWSSCGFCFRRRSPERNCRRRGACGLAEIRMGPSVFSPDSERIAYAARQGDQWHVLVDGRKGPPCDSIQPYHPVFSLDGDHIAYAATRGSEAYVVVDGVRRGTFDAVLDGFPVFSRDSKRIAYGVRRGKARQVIVQDVENPKATASGLDKPYDEIVANRFVFSANSERYAYVARSLRALYPRAGRKGTRPVRVDWSGEVQPGCHDVGI